MKARTAVLVHMAPRYIVPNSALNTQPRLLPHLDDPMLRRLGIVRARLRPTGPNEALLQHSVDHLGDCLRLSALVVVLPNAHHRHDLRRPRDTSDEPLELRGFDGLQCAPQRLGLARWVHRLAHAARHHQILRVSARRVVEHLGTRQQRILACECKAYLKVILKEGGVVARWRGGVVGALCTCAKGWGCSRG